MYKDGRVNKRICFAMLLIGLSHIHDSYVIMYPIVQVLAEIAQASWRLITGWTVRGSNPGRGEILRKRAKSHCGPNNVLYNEYRVNRPALGVDHPPPSSVEVKERIELYIYSPSWPSWSVVK
jgi:hypothetical protein